MLSRVIERAADRARELRALDDDDEDALIQAGATVHEIAGRLLYDVAEKGGHLRAENPLVADA